MGQNLCHHSSWDCLSLCSAVSSIHPSIFAHKTVLDHVQRATYLPQIASRMFRIIAVFCLQPTNCCLCHDAFDDSNFVNRIDPHHQ